MAETSLFRQLCNELGCIYGSLKLPWDVLLLAQRVNAVEQQLMTAGIDLAAVRNSTSADIGQETSIATLARQLYEKISESKEVSVTLILLLGDLSKLETRLRLLELEGVKPELEARNEDVKKESQESENRNSGVEEGADEASRDLQDEDKCEQQNLRRSSRHSSIEDTVTPAPVSDTEAAKLHAHQACSPPQVIQNADSSRKQDLVAQNDNLKTEQLEGGKTNHHSAFVNGAPAPVPRLEHSFSGSDGQKSQMLGRHSLEDAATSSGIRNIHPLPSPISRPPPEQSKMTEESLRAASRALEPMGLRGEQETRLDPRLQPRLAVLYDGHNKSGLPSASATQLAEPRKNNAAEKDSQNGGLQDKVVEIMGNLSKLAPVKTPQTGNQFQPTSATNPRAVLTRNNSAHKGDPFSAPSGLPQASGLPLIHPLQRSPVPRTATQEEKTLKALHPAINSNTLSPLEDANTPPSKTSGSPGANINTAAPASTSKPRELLLSPVQAKASKKRPTKSQKRNVWIAQISSETASGHHFAQPLTYMTEDTLRGFGIFSSGMNNDAYKILWTWDNANWLWSNLPGTEVRRRQYANLCVYCGIRGHSIEGCHYQIRAQNSDAMQAWIRSAETTGGTKRQASNDFTAGNSNSKQQRL